MWLGIPPAGLCFMPGGQLGTLGAEAAPLAPTATAAPWAGEAAYLTRPQHGCAAIKRTGDGQPQLGLLETRLQVCGLQVVQICMLE